MFRLWIERRFSRPVTAAGAVLKPQGGNCRCCPKNKQAPASLQRMNSAPLSAGGLLHSISLLNVSRIWFHATLPWVDWETPSFTKPNLA